MRLATAAAALLGSVLWAGPGGSIHGVIRDPRGALVTQARITLAGKAGAERRSTVPDVYGTFQFPDVAPGAWSLEVEAPGFRRVNIPEVVVQVDRTTRADIQLELGERTDVVEASTLEPGIEKDHATVQTVIDSRTIASMPLNGRQYLDLALLASGTVPAAPGTQGSGFSAGGIRSQSNVYLLDGVSNIDTQTNQPLNLFRITDAVREFAVQSGGALPEFGRGAGRR